MRPITVQIPHNLGRAEARHRLQHGFANIEQTLSGGLLGAGTFNNHWEGDRLHFIGRGLGQQISGTLDVQDESVRLEIDLPQMLAALAERISRQVQQAGQKLLGNS